MNRARDSKQQTAHMDKWWKSGKSAGPSGHTAVRKCVASLVFLPFCTILELPILSSCILWSSDLSFPVFWSPSNLFTGCYWAPATPIYLKIPCCLSPGTPSQIPYLQHISHIRHIWPPCRVMWSPWEQKVCQMTSIRSLNLADLTSKIDLKLILKQTCKTSRNIIILCPVKIRSYEIVTQNEFLKNRYKNNDF